jgi:hypothetical protein
MSGAAATDEQLLLILRKLPGALAPTDWDLEAGAALSDLSTEFADACQQAAAPPPRLRDLLLS